MALPQGWTLEQLLELPEIKDKIEKARNSTSEVCGLWLNQERGYMAGSSGKLRYWVFKNDRKEPGSSQPDYRLCVSRQLPRDDQRSHSLPPHPSGQGGADRHQQQIPQAAARPPQQRAPYNVDERGDSLGYESVF